MTPSLSFFPFVFGIATALMPGPTLETHPTLITSKCTVPGGCTEQTSLLVLDQLAHLLYQAAAPEYNCGDWGEAPNSTACPDAQTCAENCIVDGSSSYASYGVTTTGSSLLMKMLAPDGRSLSPRLYLLEPAGDRYEMLNLSGDELSFDVDMSKLPCGMNGALYLSEMAADGGRSDLNPTGAGYGSGYCDAQCYTLLFLNGEANLDAKGSCCNEMDIWEANARATAIAPHTCNQTSLYACSGDECAANGVCDKPGCGFNPYSKGNRDYCGPGLTVDTNRPFTDVTQFPEVDGKMTEIRRLYVQDGVVIQNAKVNTTIAGLSPTSKVLDSVSDELCGQEGVAPRYMALGGTTGMVEALERGMVLIFSIWWDEGGFMQWLDSGNDGPCNATEGDPKVIVQVEPDPVVVWSNVKWGDIGGTFSGSS